MPVPFDTHTFITDMTRAGMPAAQAEALSHQLQDIYSANAVTKQDLELAVAHLDTQLCRSRYPLCHDSTANSRSASPPSTPALRRWKAS